MVSQLDAEDDCWVVEALRYDRDADNTYISPSGPDYLALVVQHVLVAWLVHGYRDMGELQAVRSGLPGDWAGNVGDAPARVPCAGRNPAAAPAPWDGAQGPGVPHESGGL